MIAAAPTTPSSVVIVGGGISGLVTAKRLIDQGYHVEIYEGSARTGGKIQTITQDAEKGLRADLGAEFIDSDQHELIALCEEMNVKLVESQGDLTESYKLPDGRILNSDDFLKEFAPLQEKIGKDQSAIRQKIAEDQELLKRDPHGTRAHELDNMSIAQYLQELKQQVNKERADNRSFLTKAFFNPPKIDDDVVQAASQSFASECGRPASQLSALQFIHEAATTPDRLIASDCAYRIEGGTQQLTDALEKYVREKGGIIHFDSKVTTAERHGDKIHVDVEGKPEQSKDVDQIVFATQSHTIAKIKGIETLGFKEEDIDIIRNLQYTYGSKFTVNTQQPITHDNFFISDIGYQAWTKDNGEMVFLAGDDLPQRYNPKELLNLMMQDYAKAHGTTAEALFDTKHISYTGPSTNNPCYASPGVGQALPLQRFSANSMELAAHGVGVVGTYLPSPTGTNRSCGFMNDGVESANRVAGVFAARHMQMAESVEQEQGINYRNDWAERQQTPSLPDKPTGIIR